MSKTETETDPFTSIIRTNSPDGDDDKIISFDEYENLMLGKEYPPYEIADDLAGGFIFCEGDMLWFHPEGELSVASMGTSLRNALLWDVVTHEYPDGGWGFPEKTRKDVERLLAVLKEVQSAVEYALAHDIGDREWD